jgi:hypothetical protein
MSMGYLFYNHHILINIANLVPVGPPQTYLTLSLRNLGFSTTETTLLTIPSSFIGMTTMVGTAYLSEIIDSRVLSTVVLQLWALPLLIALHTFTTQTSQWVYYAVVRADNSHLNLDRHTHFHFNHCRLLSSLVRGQDISWSMYSLTNTGLGFPYIHPIQVAWTSRNSHSVRTRTVSASLYNMFVQAGAITYVGSICTIKFEC